MTNQSTIDKLIEMCLTSMADAFRNQLNDHKFKEILQILLERYAYSEIGGTFILI